jgi:hypothetical protein
LGAGGVDLETVRSFSFSFSFSFSISFSFSFSFIFSFSLEASDEPDITYPDPISPLLRFFVLFVISVGCVVEDAVTVMVGNDVVVVVVLGVVVVLTAASWALALALQLSIIVSASL